MAIVYLPSEGGVSRVGLNQQGIWFGESTGGSVIEKVKTNNLENFGNYYVDVPANLTSVSSWFYKDITDYNFLNGLVTYRAIYIGADKNFREKEILGDVSVNITHDGPIIVDDSIDVDILFDGKYTEVSSKDTLVLDDEKDTTGLLENKTGWVKTFNSTEALSPGEYLKFWIRITSKQDPALIEVSNYNYFLTIKDLTIPFLRTKGRLDTSQVFTVDLNSNELVLKSSLPNEVPTNDIYKIIEHRGFTHIFYYTDPETNPGDMTILVIQRSNLVENNKYIEVKLKEIAPDIINDPEFFGHFSECCSLGTTGTTGTTGTSGTSGTSGTPTLPTSSDPCVFKPLSDEFDEYVGNRYMNNILGSKKVERNNYFLLFNTFLSESTPEFITRYGHKNYYWNSGIINIDLNFITNNYFKDIDYGYDNRLKITPTDKKEYILENKFFTSNSIIQDDLITACGFVTEDCRQDNNRYKIYHIWEGDIVNEIINVQFFDIPQVISNEIITIAQKTNFQSDLLFNPNSVDINNFGFNRETGTLNNTVEYVKMGPPHQKRFDHGYSEVYYDINKQLDDFSTTWAFGVHGSSIITDNTSGTTGTTGTSGTTGTTGTSGTTGTTGTSGDPINETNPNQYHVIYAEDYPTSGVDDDYNYVNDFLAIFSLHCNNSPEIYALKTFYNWNTNIWKLVIKDDNDDVFVIDVEDGPILSSTFDNVITLNVNRSQVYGCFKKFIVQYSIHINGVELINGTTYTSQTTDTYIVTHNFDNSFSGYISYWEVKNYLEKEAELYSQAMFNIFSNISWAKLENEADNVINQETTLKNFNFRRNIVIKNLNWNSNESLVYPIVLQGTGYDIGDEYNEEIRRSVFDFTKIDINKKSFAFTYEGTTDKLDWIADTFDVDRDILVIWVRLDNWNGQKITMYYSDNRIVEDSSILENRPYMGYHSVWHMNEIVKIPRSRFVETKIYNGGELLVSAKDNNDELSLIEVIRPYVNGIHYYYKSNKFDVRWNDIEYDVNDTNEINDFLKETIRLIKPNYMEVDVVTSTNDYIIEAKTNKG